MWLRPCMRWHCLQRLHDQVLLDRDEVLTQQGRPYSVFTPYKRAWLQSLDDFSSHPTPSIAMLSTWRRRPPVNACPRCQSWALAPPLASSYPLPTA